MSLLLCRGEIFIIESVEKGGHQFWDSNYIVAKGHLISKANCQAVNSSKKRTNEFIFTSMQRVFVRFLEDIEDSEKAFRNYLTFIVMNNINESRSEYFGEKRANEQTKYTYFD